MLIGLPRGFSGDGRSINIIGWSIAILTIVSLAYTIYHTHRQVTKTDEKEVEQQKEVDEIKMNLKLLLGDRYVKLK